MIATKEELELELKVIQSFCEETASEDATEAVLRGNDLAVYMARTGKMIADCKHHRDLKLRSEMIAEFKNLTSFPASVATKFTDALVEHETYLLTWATRLNAACTHQLDWCRTIISKAKAEMQNFGN